MIKIPKDPVCEKEIEPEEAAAEHVHEDEKFFFCSKGCKEKFMDNPDKYKAPGGR